jgi:threonine synthase
VVDFEGALLTGLASDGGLYVPERLPSLEIGDHWEEWDYARVAAAVIAPFTTGTFDHDSLLEMATEAYGRFRHPEVAPVRPLAGTESLLELFWGPTLSFKDYALQLVGRMLDEVLVRRRERVVVIGATSGDTGSAAIEALRDREAIEVVILHPHGRVSEVQRRQMTTVPAANVHNLAVEGTFDDCQDIVKALFGDDVLREALRPAAVNSINWGRIMVQAAYYVWATLRLGSLDRGIAFSVPTGNFGNVYAAYVARSIGLPIRQLIVGNNANRGLTEFLETGHIGIGRVVQTLAPAMDIQVPSNLERLLFDVYEGRGRELAAVMDAFRENGELEVLPAHLASVRQLMSGAWYSDDEIIDTIRDLNHETGVVVDPHTATGVAAGRALRRDPSIPLVAVATAHPAKFPEAVRAATHLDPELPDDLADLWEREERFDVVENDLEVVRAALLRLAG